MINLLPKEEIEQLKNEENFRIGVNMGIFLFFFLLFLSLALFSLKIYFRGELQTKEIILKTEEIRLDLQAEKEIEKYNQLLSTIETFQKEKVYFFPIFEEISKILPQGIYLESFSIEISPKKEILGTISGIASKREIFLELIEILKEKYKNVSFPPQILFKQESIDFSINFEIK